MESNPTAEACPGGVCFELLGRKWTAHILWALGEGPRRFSELLKLIPGVSDRMLARRLRELEAAGIVIRSHHPQIPPRVEYALAAPGRDLTPVIRAMEKWASRWPHGLKKGGHSAGS